MTPEELARAMGYSDPNVGTADDMVLFQWHRDEDDYDLRLAAARIILARLAPAPPARINDGRIPVDEWTRRVAASLSRPADSTEET